VQAARCLAADSPRTGRMHGGLRHPVTGRKLRPVVSHAVARGSIAMPGWQLSWAAVDGLIWCAGLPARIIECIW